MPPGHWVALDFTGGGYSPPPGDAAAIEFSTGGTQTVLTSLAEFTAASSLLAMPAAAPLAVDFGGAASFAPTSRLGRATSRFEVAGAGSLLEGKASAAHTRAQTMMVGLALVSARSFTAGQSISTSDCAGAGSLDATPMRGYSVVAGECVGDAALAGSLSIFSRSVVESRVGAGSSFMAPFRLGVGESSMTTTGGGSLEVMATNPVSSFGCLGGSAPLFTTEWTESLFSVAWGEEEMSGSEWWTVPGNSRAAFAPPHGQVSSFEARSLRAFPITQASVSALSTLRAEVPWFGATVAASSDAWASLFFLLPAEFSVEGGSAADFPARRQDSGSTLDVAGGARFLAASRCSRVLPALAEMEGDSDFSGVFDHSAAFHARGSSSADARCEQRRRSHADFMATAVFSCAPVVSGVASWQGGGEADWLARRGFGGMKWVAGANFTASPRRSSHVKTETRRVQG